MKNLDIRLYMIGEKRDVFKNLAKKHNIDFIESVTIQNAVSEISRILKENEIALLSPACASFDQFESYKHRGEEFKKCINSL